MKQRKEQPLGLTDIDPQLAELTREKEAQVREMVMFPGHHGGAANAAIAASRAAAAQQTATLEGQTALDAFRTNERADEAIRAEIKRGQKGMGKFSSGPAAMMFPLLFLPLLLLPIAVFSMLGWPPAAHHVMGTFMPLMMILFFVLMFLRFAMQGRKRKTIALPVLREVLPAVARTPGERSYADAAIEVCDASQGTLGAMQAREMMRSLNSLLDSERTLDAQRESIDRAMNDQSLDAAHAERDRLQERLNATHDEAARETLRQSLELCEGRLEQTQRLAPMRERIDAQQEAIHQVMASVRSSLAGLGVYGAATDQLAAASAATAPQTVALRETATHLQSRARAVEQAVQEVAALRVRG